jgi:hypothetical protein
MIIQKIRKKGAVFKEKQSRTDFSVFGPTGQGETQGDGP